MRPELVKTWLQDLQSKIVAALEAVDGQPFVRDGWTRRVAGHPMTFTSRGVRIGHQLSFDTTLQEMGLAEG